MHSGMLSSDTKVTDICSEHERVSYKVRVILILPFLHLRRADELVVCVVFPRLLDVGVGCVCLYVIFLHASTIIPKYYVLNLFFCVFGPKVAAFSVLSRQILLRVLLTASFSVTFTPIPQHCHNQNSFNNFSGHSKRQCVATMLALLQEQVSVPA